MTQLKVAKEAFMAENQLSRILKGRAIPSDYEKRKISKVLGIPVTPEAMTALFKNEEKEKADAADASG
jgi:transcriptional regulator with XRE-family HTH domain